MFSSTDHQPSLVTVPSLDLSSLRSTEDLLETSGSFLSPVIQASIRQAQQRGRVAFQAGAYADAVKWFSESLSLGEAAAVGTSQATERASLLLARGTTWSKLHEHRRAVDDAEAALALDPENARAVGLKGASLIKLKQYAEASDTFLAGLKLHPTNDDLRTGFYHALRGLRLNWHQYAPAFTHMGPTHSDTIVSASTAAAQHTNVLGATADRTVNSVMKSVGAMLDLDPLLEAEFALYRRMHVTIDIAVERAALLGIILEYQEVLLALFCKYCDTSETGGLLTARATYRPISMQRSMSEGQFWQFCVDYGIVTQTFNRQAVRSAWAASLRRLTKGDVTRPQPPAGSEPAGMSEPVPGPHLWTPAGKVSSRDEAVTNYKVARAWNDAFPVTHFITPRPPSASDAGDSSKPSTPPRTARPIPRSRHMQSPAVVAKPDTVSDSSKPLEATALFPKFIEALVSLVAARYRPALPPIGTPIGALSYYRAPTSGPPQSPRAAMSAISSPRTGGNVQPAKVEIATLTKRIKYAFDSHLLSPPALHSSALYSARVGRPTATTDAETVSAADQEWSDAMESMDKYHSKLRKVFFLFAASDHTKRTMDVREFLFMLKSLGLTDTKSLTLSEACRVVVAVIGFVGDCERQKLDFSAFCDALAKCCDVKTYDGLMPLASRLDNFLVGEFFQQVRAKTNIASLWQ